MTLKPAIRAPVPVGRRVVEALAPFSPPPRDVSIGPRRPGGIPAELNVPQGSPPAIRMVYLHGGGYRLSSPRTHRGLVGHLAKTAGISILSVDYRLAPEHPCPAAIADALAAWEAVVAIAPGDVVIGGDSAGGGLALATAIAARDGGLPPPAGIALISPWTDLAMTGRSIAENAPVEAVLTPRALCAARRDYCGDLAFDDPRCSPLYADLANLPPLLIHSGTHDLLQSECEALAARARAAGTEAELRVYDGLWHDFHVHTGMLRDADEAVAEMGAWIATRLN